MERYFVVEGDESRLLRIHRRCIIANLLQWRILKSLKGDGSSFHFAHLSSSVCEFCLGLSFPDFFPYINRFCSLKIPSFIIILFIRIVFFRNIILLTWIVIYYEAEATAAWVANEKEFKNFLIEAINDRCKINNVKWVLCLNKIGIFLPNWRKIN